MLECDKLVNKGNAKLFSRFIILVFWTVSLQHVRTAHKVIQMVNSGLSLLQYLIIRNAAYYDTDQYPNYYKVLEIYTGYFDSLDIMILFSYPSSIVIMRD